MKATILEKAGGVENLVMKEIDKPVINENEVLIEVKAISINPVDFKVRGAEQVINLICGEERPVILGWDIAGTVAKVGNEGSQFKKGDKVFGMVNFPGQGKAYAEFVAAPENQLAKMPGNVSFEEAAATTLAALTAYQALQGRVKKGDRVLIHAGSGGVGHFAIQIAKNMSAYVVATSSAKNKDFVLSLGADEHIDYRTQAFEEVTTNIDFVLDGMSGDVLVNSMKVMNEGGSIVTLTSPPDFIEKVQKGTDKIKFTITPLMVQSNGKDMNTLKDMLASGTLKAHLSQSFPFSEMGNAHLALESGRTVGKVVVTI